jgi:hypothetical protein
VDAGHGVGGVKEGASARVQLLQQDTAMGLESGQINLNGTPDKAITNVQIFMGQKIAKVDDLSALRYGSEQGWHLREITLSASPMMMNSRSTAERIRRL